MGLDSIEILVNVEDTFDIKIPNHEAEQILTVGDFHNAVWQHLAGKHTEKCKSQYLFYRLRKLFADKFNFFLQDLKLDISPEEVFPKTNRRQVYLNFADTANLQLPNLVLTKPWNILLTTFGIATIIGGFATSLILINFFDISKWTLVLPIIGIILTVQVSELLNPKRIEIKEKTIREFIQHILALNYSKLLAKEGTNRQEMESVINHIIADIGGVDLEEVTSEKKIADDLGIN